MAYSMVYIARKYILIGIAVISTFLLRKPLHDDIHSHVTCECNYVEYVTITAVSVYIVHVDPMSRSVS